MYFKFLGPNRADFFDHRMLRFSQPFALNDPFESARLIIPPGTMAQHREEAREAIMNSLRESNFDPTTKDEKNELDEILKYADGVVENLHTPQNYGRGMIESCNRMMGILSLSRAHDNLLMWAHYADSHKGFVLGMDEKSSFFEGTNLLGERTRPANVGASCKTSLLLR